MFESADEIKDLIVENQITDADIEEILHHQKFKQAIKTIFGTTDLNELFCISQGVIRIKKYVDLIHENTITLETDSEGKK